jgi:tripartite-type tricarboxylate transporter receptor subunit TctC
MDRRVFLHATRAVLLGATIPGRAWAAPEADYPTRSVTIIVPFAPGSAADGMTRLCAQLLTQRLSQSFIVENIAGASGTIGTARVARAEPDGYTLVIGSSATITVAPFLFKKLPYDSMRDLVPVATLGDSPMVVAVPRASPFRSLAELVAAAKAKPGVLSFGSGGAGSAAHIAAEVFQWKTGTSFVHIPYRGVAAAVPDLVAGRLDALFVSYPAVQPMAHGGAIRVLAVAAEQRSSLVPDTPTAAEAGVNDYVLSAWNGLMAPRGIDAVIVARLNAALNAILTDQEVVKRLAGMGMAPIPGSPEEFTQRIEHELVEMGELTKIAKITAD